MPIFNIFLLVPVLAQLILLQNTQYWFILPFLIPFPLLKCPEH